MYFRFVRKQHHHHPHMEKNLREVARVCTCHVYTKKANSEVTGYTYHVQKSKQSNIWISLKCCTNLSAESSDYKVTHLLVHVCTVYASAKDFTLYLNLSTALRAVFTRFMWRCEENEEEELGKIEAIGRTWTAIIWKNIHKTVTSHSFFPLFPH